MHLKTEINEKSRESQRSESDILCIIRMAPGTLRAMRRINKCLGKSR